MPTPAPTITSTCALDHTKPTGQTRFSFPPIPRATAVTCALKPIGNPDRAAQRCRNGTIWRASRYSDLSTAITAKQVSRTEDTRDLLVASCANRPRRSPPRRRARSLWGPAYPRKEERVFARFWLIAPPGSAHPGRRRDDCIPRERSSRPLRSDERSGDKAVARRGRPNARAGSAYSDGPTHNIEEIKR
jgi:hypothetical protein